MANRLHYTTSSLLLVMTTIAIALGWWRDHHRLQEQIVRLQDPPPHWDTDQLLGPPDTHRFGDVSTAWASKTPDGRQEWIILEYEKPVLVKCILVHETFNPGAVHRVVLFGVDGKEHLAWEGVDPLPITASGGIATINFLPQARQIKTRRIKLFLDSPRVPGWNEIDAVGLVGASGTKQWAIRAYASSSYGRNNSRWGVSW